MNYFLLAVLWVLWCTLHSGMISITATRFFERWFGSGFRFYRLFFNLIALATLAPVVMHQHSLRVHMVFQWDGLLVVFQALLLATGVLLFILGGRHYRASQLLGIHQIRTGNAHKTLGKSGRLRTTGVLGVTRHPWYLGALLVIWARDLYVSTLITNIILSVYLVVGTILEERKLLMEFGDEYRDYQGKVSMLIPFKLLRPGAGKSKTGSDGYDERRVRI